MGPYWRVGDLEAGTGFYNAGTGPGIRIARREAVFESGHSTAEQGTRFEISGIANRGSMSATASGFPEADGHLL